MGGEWLHGMLTMFFKIPYARAENFLTYMPNIFLEVSKTAVGRLSLNIQFSFVPKVMLLKVVKETV